MRSFLRRSFSHYDEMGLGKAKDSTFDEIKQAYLINSLRYHPHKDMTAFDKHYAKANFVRQYQAFEVLSNRKARARYDAALNGDYAAPDGMGAAMASGVVDAAWCACFGLAAAAVRVCCFKRPSLDEEGCDSDDASSSDDEPTSSASKAGTPRLFFTYFGGDARLLGGTRDQETEAEPTGLHDSEQKMNLNLTWPASMASMASS